MCKTSTDVPLIFIITTYLKLKDEGECWSLLVCIFLAPYIVRCKFSNAGFSHELYTKHFSLEFKQGFVKLNYECEIRKMTEHFPAFWRGGGGRGFTPSR